MHRLRTVTYLDVSAVAGHHAMPAALLLQLKRFLPVGTEPRPSWAVSQCLTN